MKGSLSEMSLCDSTEILYNMLPNAICTKTLLTKCIFKCSKASAEASLWSYLFAKGVHKHPHGRQRPHHEGRVAACVPSKVHLKLFGCLQHAGEEDVAEFVDVEQRGPFDAKLPYGRLHSGRTVLQEQLAGFGRLTCEDQL